MARKKKRVLKHPPHKLFKGWLYANSIKQKEIAELLNLSPVTVNQKLNGTLSFTWSEVELICNTYELEYEIFKTL
jgi:transcriptional regulator with XRE-family HTH domain